MKSFLSSLVIFNLFLTLAQSAVDEPQVEIIVENYTEPGETIGTALFTGMNVFAGLANTQSAVYGKARSGVHIFGAISGVSQMFLGVGLILNTKTIEANQVFINQSRMRLGLLNLSVGAFSFLSSIYAASNRQHEKDKAVSWNVQGGPIHDGRGGFMLGFSKRF